MRITIVLMFLFISIHLLGEIDPTYYEMDQKSAPEYISITVTKVKKGLCFFCKEQDIRITARVDKVVRTASALKAGDVITITYTHFNPPKHWVGPRPIPILEKRKSYPAFLKSDQKNGNFIPAARGYSFGPILIKKKI